jgi:hypothetical protein
MKAWELGAVTSAQRLGAACISMVMGALLSACNGNASVSGPKCGSSPSQIVDFNVLSKQMNGAALSTTHFAVDGTNVYFVFNSVLMSVPIRGGPVRTLAQLASDPDEILVTPSHIVLPVRTGNELNETLLSISVAGGGVITLASSSNVFSGVAVDDTNVYFIDGEGTKSVPLGGGDVRLITSNVTASNITGQAVVIGSDLIVSCCTQPGVVGSTEGNILSIPLDGGMVETLAMGQPNASFPLACGADICWWTAQTPFGVAGTQGPGFAARLAPDGGLTTLPNAPFPAWSFTFDGTAFFETVGCDLCSGSLIRIPLSGGAPVPMTAANFVAVDDQCAYYDDLFGIYKVDKSYHMCCQANGGCVTGLGPCPGEPMDAESDGGEPEPADASNSDGGLTNGG